jgi:hypothetical protein
MMCEHLRRVISPIGLWRFDAPMRCAGFEPPAQRAAGTSMSFTAS